MRHHKSVLWGWYLVILISLWGITRIERRVDLVDYFRKENIVQQSEKLLKEKFNGSMPLYVNIKGDVQSPEGLRLMKETQAFMEQFDYIPYSQSVADLIEQMNEVMGEGAVIPDEQAKISQLWFLLDGQEIMEQLVNYDLTEGLTLNQYADRLEMPRHNLKEGASLGFRLKGFALNTDFSLSYIYGRETLPFVSHVRLSPAGMQGETNVHSELFFPRYHMLGADLAGTIGKVGVWAEAGVFFPEREIIMTTDLSLLYGQPAGTITSDSTLMKKDPYTRFVFGADYTFRNGTYLNAQFMHGFFHERGRGNLNDYLIIAAERSVLHDKWLLRPLAGGVVISDWGEPKNNYALFYTPEITYRGIDNLEVGMGAYLFDGKGENIFAGFRDFNMLSARVKLNF